MSGGENTPPNPNPGGNASQEPGNIAEQERTAADILGERGEKAIIAKNLSERDRENIVAEAIEMKEAKERANKGFFMRVVVNRTPIIGTLVKANAMRKFKKTIGSADNLTEGLKELGIDYKDLKTLNNTDVDSNERAYHIIENGIYNEEGTKAHSLLDENEVVELVGDKETQKKVKDAFYKYYEDFKKKKGDVTEEERKEYRDAFDETMKEALAGEKDSELLMKSMENRLSDLEILSKDKETTKKKVKDYVYKNGSLYRATTREGVYAKKEVDSLTNAVIAGSVFGIVAAAFGTREVRSATSKIATALGGSNVLGGAVAGAAAGAIRGVDKARVNLSKAEIKDATTFDGPKAEEDTSSNKEGSAEIPDRDEKKLAILERVKKYGVKGMVKGEDRLDELKANRNRINASDRTSELNELVEKLNGNIDEETRNKTKKELEEKLFDAVARGRLSSKKQIDLIRYKDDEERNNLEKAITEAAKQFYSSDNLGVYLANEAGIDEREKALSEKYEEAKKIEARYKARIIAVNAVSGAIIGAGLGIIKETGAFGFLHSEDANMGETANANNFELVDDPDGGYTVKIGGEELIGKGEEPGINFNNDGTLTAESEDLLKNAGIGFEAHESAPIEIAHANINIKEYFNPENREANNLTEITSRNWVTDNLGHDQAIVGTPYMDGNGNIVMQVVPTQGSNINMDDMKMVFTAGDGNINNAIVVDVNDDGLIEIPAGSPAASLFNNGEYQGGYAELANVGADGHMDVYSTIGDGHPDINTISVPDSDVTYTDGYTFTYEGQSQNIELPEEIAATAKMEAINGVESMKGLGESVYNEANGEITSLQTNAGEEAVTVDHFEHHGGYSDIYDSYFGEKDGVYNSGASLVRQMLGDEGRGLSSQEADQLFLEKINNGEISEGDVIEDYLKALGNSPEALVTTRSMLGNFEMDLDGDGVKELIDTQDEINLAADILGSGDSEAYDNFVNDTYNTFYEKIAGGSIRFVDQSQEQYQYTTWGVLGDGNNILQRLGVVGDRPTDGVGIIFMDKDGNSIYDEETVRKLWHLPDNYDINYVADRLDCIQKTARGAFLDGDDVEGSHHTPGHTPDHTPDDTPDHTPDDTPDHTPDDTPGPTEPEPTEPEPTEPEPTEPEPKDYENMERIDDNIDKDIEHNIGTDDIQHHDDLGTGEKTEQPAHDDYQGTEPKIVENEPSKAAEKVQEKVSDDNDYSKDLGHEREDSYKPVKPDNAGAEAAKQSETPKENLPGPDDSGSDEILDDLGI